MSRPDHGDLPAGTSERTLFLSQDAGISYSPVRDHEPQEMNSLSADNGPNPGKAMPQSSATSKSDDTVNHAVVRTSSSWSSIGCLVADLLLALPAIAFLVYAGMVMHHKDKPITQDPVPDLFKASRYGPTIFPIFFAAVAANLLKSVAAWKLERGISVLSLDLLLNSRTVFSTFTSPLIIGAVNGITPLIMIFWALSPLGGQAALRVISEQATTNSTSWSYNYLDFNNRLSHSGPGSSAGDNYLPSINGAFAAALSSPKSVKDATQDIFGNLKIPMIEALEEQNAVKNEDGWYHLSDTDNITYSSVAGLPLQSVDKRTLSGNHSFVVDTSYMYATCKLTHKVNTTTVPAYFAAANITNFTSYSNHQTCLIGTSFFHNTSGNDPRQLFFSSWTWDATTNATCNLTTSFISVDVHCHNSDCGAVRARKAEKPAFNTTLTVLDGIGPFGNLSNPTLQAMYFLESFVNSTNGPWDYQASLKRTSTPLEYYFTSPDDPYSGGLNLSPLGWYGSPIYTIGDTLFSQRFSQLLNTFWIPSVAPRTSRGNITFRDIDTIGNLTSVDQNPFPKTTTGERTPDELVMHINKPWFGVLVVASIVMFIASIAAALLGSLRRGPAILDQASSLMRYNPHVSVLNTGNSLEDGSDMTRRLKNARVCIGDVQSHHETGHIAIATVGEAVPLSLQQRTRKYQ